MQLIRLTAATVLFAALSGPAAAGICILTLDTGGALALSSDGARLGSEEPSGRSAIIGVASIGSSTLTIAAPTLIQYPAGYNPVGLALEVSYRSTALGSVSQPYTTAQTSISVPNLANAVLLTVDNRVTTPTGFAAGTYQTRTIVTCS